MIAEAMQWLRENTRQNVQMINGLPHVEKSVALASPPLPPVVLVETLSAFVGLAESGMDGMAVTDCFVQVHNHYTVHLNSLMADPFGRRRNFVSAGISDSCSFQFGRFMDPEQFVISLQSHFVEDAASKALLALASSLTAENVVIAEDDGISQVATARQGVSLKTNKKIEPKVKLRPFRTFREVEQPASMFLFRLQSRENQPPSCALFEADGGAWKLEAVSNISAFLKEELPKEVQVIF